MHLSASYFFFKCYVFPVYSLLTIALGNVLKTIQLFFNRCLIHRCFRFDVPKIIKLAESLNLIKELTSFVKGFGDTVPMFKEVLPNRKKEKKSFSQPMLVEDYLPKTDILTAHNATNDVIMLDKLLKAVNIEKSVIINNTQTISFITNSKDR